VHRHLAPDTRAAVVDALVGAHRELLAFVERRVGNRAEAEDIVQSAVVTALEKGQSVRDPERVVAWIYQLLRHRITDTARRRHAEERALAHHAALADDSASAEELDDAVCRCVSRLIDTLKPEYADILRRTELEEKTPADVARELGLTPGNAAVRAHRAREALRREVVRSCRTCADHGCLDCTCTRRPAGSGV
jgi:RNA polymerase sigma-70 factor (ECF subfamily)